jgi:hypothetical protein
VHGNVLSWHGSGDQRWRRHGVGDLLFVRHRIAARLFSRGVGLPAASVGKVAAILVADAAALRSAEAIWAWAVPNAARLATKTDSERPKRFSEFDFILHLL